MSPLRALMVDLDGTLARTAEANLQAYTAALAEAGVRITPAEFEAQVQGRNWKQFLPAMLEAAGCTTPPERIAARKAELYVGALGTIELNLGLVRLLEASRPHLRTALVTSASRRNALALLEAHGLNGLFDLVVTGDDVREHKPHPEAYALAASRLGVLPAETLVYEDSDIGVRSAQAFGAHVIRVVF